MYDAVRSNSYFKWRLEGFPALYFCPGTLPTAVRGNLAWEKFESMQEVK
jgi:hypothetical protein